MSKHGLNGWCKLSVASEVVKVKRLTPRQRIHKINRHVCCNTPIQLTRGQRQQCGRKTMSTQVRHLPNPIRINGVKCCKSGPTKYSTTPITAPVGAHQNQGVCQMMATVLLQARIPINEWTTEINLPRANPIECRLGHKNTNGLSSGWTAPSNEQKLVMGTARNVS